MRNSPEMLLYSLFIAPILLFFLICYLKKIPQYKKILGLILGNSLAFFYAYSSTSTSSYTPFAVANIFFFIPLSIFLFLIFSLILMFKEDPKSRENFVNGVVTFLITLTVGIIIGAGFCTY